MADLSTPEIWTLFNPMTKQIAKIKGNEALLALVQRMTLKQRQECLVYTGTGTVHMTVEQFLNNDRRRHPRFKSELNVMVISDEASFETVTVDISLGGIKLKDPIPEKLLKNSNIVILLCHGKNQFLNFKAELLGNTEHGSRLQFDAEHSSIDALKSLLKSEVRNLLKAG